MPVKILPNIFSYLVQESFSLLYYQMAMCACSVASNSATFSMEFSRQGYWNGLPFLPPGNFPDPGIESVSLPSPALAGRFFTTVPPWVPPPKEPLVANFLSFDTRKR